MKELKEKCWLLKNAFKIDIEVVNEQFATVLQITDDNAPLLIIEARKHMYPDLYHSLLKAEHHSFCFHTDSFQLSYLATTLEDYKGMIIAGPFLNEPLTNQFIWNVIKKNGLDQSWFTPLENYFKTIPFLDEASFALGDFLVNICVHPLVSTQVITMQNNESSIKRLQPQEYDKDDMSVAYRYDIEKTLLHYVEVGDKKNALKSLVNFSGEFLYRVPGNPLRARKNISFSYSTMLRLSANRGGVAPPFLHSISEKFALKIEEAITISELDALDITMTEEYCDAVKNLAIKGHSSVVKQALMYINLHFNETINLQSVADELRFNRTYIAKKFKDEIKLSVIDYIHKKRIEEAIFLIEQGRLSITDISSSVGFSSYNYFCKVFKEATGMTATEYKKGTRIDT